MTTIDNSPAHVLPIVVTTVFAVDPEALHPLAWSNAVFAAIGAVADPTTTYAEAWPKVASTTAGCTGEFGARGACSETGRVSAGQHEHVDAE
ncbi:hypothetical protein HND25_26780 [Rhodococcus erythropolis]|uniref:hypothetical protein n=1 Tax=Rhodococcus erythropolis TaxID=1833 RepID=UPI0004221E40|nr:hypothetical protein [Rhodococcus erythropolis]MBO8149917.1 hypothetical protein [Rhodococcus erythropolis]MDO1492186.1 hypothetical protein [Rhodococcus erythropolis]